MSRSRKRAGKPWVVNALPREELESFCHRSVLNIVFKVTADGSSHVSEASVFPVLMLLLRKQYRDSDGFQRSDLGFMDRRVRHLMPGYQH